MKLPLVSAFLKTLPRYKESTDGRQCVVKCHFCGDSTKSDTGHLSIKIDVDEGEGLLFKCFRADCQHKGILTSSILQDMGCNDLDTLLELAGYNKTINKSIEKGFNVKTNRNYQLVNLSISDNKKKLDYINQRLGTNFTTEDLRRFKIQLGLYEFLRVNYINKLAFDKKYCDIIDEWTISFLSMYSDYLICRDISSKEFLGKKYTMYRISGKPNPTDMKLYCIPTEISLLDPNPAEINVAEGAFSIIGAYLYGGYGKTEPNSLWLANCGSEYLNTILHVIKQYGFLDIRLNIWSDSEIGLKKYEKLLKELNGRLHLSSMDVLYNEADNDFGHPKDHISTKKISLI